jgi:hypothetical protein
VSWPEFVCTEYNAGPPTAIFVCNVILVIISTVRKSTSDVLYVFTASRYIQHKCYSLHRLLKDSPRDFERMVCIFPVYVITLGASREKNRSQRATEKLKSGVVARVIYHTDIFITNWLRILKGAPSPPCQKFHFINVFGSSCLDTFQR